jgi:zinc transport system substrate-binding protein
VAVALVTILLGAGAAIVLSSNGTNNSSSKLQVVATFYPLYYFSDQIGGDKIEASMLIPDNAEPHSWEPSPSDLNRVNSADILVYNGQGFEPWMSSFLDSTDNRHMLVVDTSKNISLMMSSEVREVYDTANGILTSGPNSSVTASSSDETASVIEAAPGNVNVAFSSMSGGNGGIVGLSVPESGDYRFFFTNSTIFRITDRNGAEISYEMSVGQVPSYPMFNGSKFFELEAGETYQISFGPSDVTGTNLIMVHAVEEEPKDGHHHGFNDPHFWLDPLNAKVQVDNILDAFKSADPGNATFYQENADDLKVRLDALNQEFEVGLANRTKNAIITTHEGFDYLAARYGFQAYAAIGISADSQPSAQDMANLTQKVNSLGLHYVFGEPIYSDSIIQTIASETGAQVLVLDGIHGRTGEHAGWDYFQIMEDNLKSLEKGMEVAPSTLSMLPFMTLVD